MNIPNDSPSSNDDDVELKLDDASAVGFIEQQITDAMAREPGLEAGNAIKNHVIIAMSLGLVPLPLFDLALLSGNQVAMIAALAKIYDVPFEEHRAKSIVVSLLAGTVPVLGVVGLSSGIKLIPGIGTLFGSGGVALSGGAITYAVGRAFADHFDSGRDLFDLDLNQLRARLRSELKRGKEVAEAALAAVKSSKQNPSKPNQAGGREQAGNSAAAATHYGVNSA
ncbi:MAG: DUF697 domain-containing protein [Thiohalocapsa sp. PB-PSB1]|jgi:uncharacterized protein (DUF697 family)|nr:MAG: hypothetical protein N838_11675 [Thiohalocapsa sp. PB-PSB1]QQO52235.1 MAG: DUF697 domain-containing protein [Thiohalocapsa sp. PB-PSB1]HCS92529.1 DUF697 domain-containing protein [Chromatiaceae bacterium]